MSTCLWLLQKLEFVQSTINRLSRIGKNQLKKTRGLLFAGLKSGSLDAKVIMSCIGLGSRPSNAGLEYQIRPPTATRSSSTVSTRSSSSSSDESKSDSVSAHSSPARGSVMFSLPGFLNIPC